LGDDEEDILQKFVDCSKVEKLYEGKNFSMLIKINFEKFLGNSLKKTFEV
jgi:hypothetical protein